MIDHPFKVLTIFGTRPEVIKLAPVLIRLGAQPEMFKPLIAVTAQHREMLDQMMRVFDLRSDYDLDVMQPRQTLLGLTARALSGLQDAIDHAQPDLVLVQGDTTTTFVGALAAFYNHIPVAHIEAGLRTHDRSQPFPEEINRRLCDAVSDLHFAATDWARDNLLRENVSADHIWVTGNTVIDALFYVLDRYPPARSDSTERRILVTIHRRENWGEPMQNVCRALRRVIERYADARLILPLHLNPIVREIVTPILGGLDRVDLIEPLDYVSFVQAMQRSFLIVTDSGGVQEEAPSLGKPVLVLRNVTERPEGVIAGTVKVIGTDEPRVYESIVELLEDAETYTRMSRAVNPYGDGHAAERIVDHLQRWLTARSQRST